MTVDIDVVPCILKGGNAIVLAPSPEGENIAQRG